MNNFFFTAVIFFFFGNGILIAQVAEKTILDISKGDCFNQESIIDEESDTLNYYFIFEAFFIDDTVIVYSNEQPIIKEVIITDQIVGRAKMVRVGDISQIRSIGFKINQRGLVTIKPDPHKAYYRIRYNDSMNLVEICVAKYMPVSF
ncbi:MAG: hypothetical protein JW801_10395 [Bacteroidales bacterium]|nr:hypothetical protein [Bacteroidales bacterium]